MFNKIRAAHLNRGDQAEQQALDFLVKQGLRLVERNYRCRRGELDLIMQDRQTLVIVEVRLRRSNQYGGALESITARKQSRIIAATEHYIMSHRINSAIRFDVIAISGDHSLNWIQNAFH
ncbi:YraN family protein [Methylomarinum sp. Ch1-1]|uniref:UPF0102 protein Q9L42_006275 n=1 Tax=Methylomarinum roseum TaxID=3067653 RepID=A0AAU7NXJ9_9GAMM|nr:YraN family protein [Methylomarinum sp. Ch1-1]MDP4522179.1 YraN family protein [Methylomarinum sp. Ch1-1]